MTYRAPVSEIAFTMRHVAGLDRAIAEGLYARPHPRPRRDDPAKRPAGSPTT